MSCAGSDEQSGARQGEAILIPSASRDDEQLTMPIPSHARMMGALGFLSPLVLALPRLAARSFRSRPTTSLFITLLVLSLSTGVVLYSYAKYQWRIAQAAIADGRAVEAGERLRVCLLVWPRSVPVQLMAARAARMHGNLEASEAHLNRCLKLSGGATEAIQLEFLLLRAQAGEEDEVAPALIHYIENGHSEAVLILETMAKAYMHNLKYGSAYAFLSRWIEQVPQEAKAYLWRAWVLERLDNATEAMEDYRRSLELDPDLFEARLRVAEMLMEETRPLEALPHLERLYKAHPDRPLVKARLGHCRLLQGKTEEARTLLYAAVEDLPEDPALLHNLAKLELQERKPAEAELWLRKALEVDQADTEALYTLSTALRDQGRTQEATVALKEHERKTAILHKVNRMLKEQARKQGTDPNVHAELGALLLSIGQTRLGRHWLNQALVRDPGHQAAHRSLAEYYESIGDQEKAAQHRSRLLPDPRKTPGKS